MSLQAAKVDAENEVEERASELQRAVETLTSEADGLQQQLAEAWEAAQQNLKKAQAKQKIQHDCHAKEMNFKVGD